MRLQEVSIELRKCLEEIQESLPKLEKIETEYQTQYHQRMFKSGMGNQDLRAAEALESMKTDGLYEPWAEAKLNMKLLWNKKDILIELSRNLRVIEMVNNNYKTE